MIKDIVKHTEDKEKVLTTPTKPIIFDEEKDLDKLIQDLTDSCIAAKGLGLAANQIGISKRIAILMMPKDEEFTDYERTVLINPEIVAKEGEMIEEEGCLSFPGLYKFTRRFKKVTVRYIDEKGIPMEITAEGLMSKAIQHEVDHLDGQIFTDKALSHEEVAELGLKSASEE